MIYTANDGAKVAFEIDRPNTAVNNLRYNIVSRITHNGRVKALTNKAHQHLVMEFSMQTREGRKEASKIIEEEAGGTNYLSIVEGYNIRLIIEDVKMPEHSNGTPVPVIDGRYDA